jgi:hypothetical protein
MSIMATTFIKEEIMKAKQADLTYSALIYSDDQTAPPMRHTRVAAVTAFILSAFSILIVPGIISLFLGHRVMGALEKDIPATDRIRGMAQIAVIITYVNFAVLIFSLLLKLI